MIMASPNCTQFANFLGTYSRVWQSGLWSFQTEDTKLEKILHKNQHTQQILSFGLWLAVKKCQNLTFKVNFLCQKLSESFSILFH